MTKSRHSNKWMKPSNVLYFMPEKGINFHFKGLRHDLKLQLIGLRREWT